MKQTVNYNYKAFRSFTNNFFFLLQNPIEKYNLKLTRVELENFF